MTKTNEISRRRFLSAIGSTATTSLLSAAAGTIFLDSAEEAHAEENGNIGISRQALAPAPLLLLNPSYRLLVDVKTGSIVSFQPASGVGRDLLIRNHRQLPLFQIELMDDKLQFKKMTATEAREISVQMAGEPSAPVLTMSFKELAGLPLHARVTARCPLDESLTYWNIEIDNRTSSWIANIQFPVIEVPFDEPNGESSSHLLWSISDGTLASPVVPSISDGIVQNTPEIWRSNNYPGQWASTQLMAYYNEAGGLYVACDDATGLPKFISPVLEENGVVMGLGHFPGARGPGLARLPYSAVIGTFSGDWYAAAEIYRNWASKQHFCSAKLGERQDVPKWIDESPIGIAFPMRGEGDWDPPAKVNPEYTPATNALPYLEKLALELDCSLMPIIFNWEHAGPWVQPDAYPALGGDEAMREFMAKAKEKGWHPVIYGDGLYWVTAQGNTAYDGLPYLQSHGGEAAVTRKWDGSLWQDVWPWRKSYWACVGTEAGKKMVLDMTSGMAGYRPDVIQQFDQGPGPRACYATDHRHPPVPGPWMGEGFKKLLDDDEKQAHSIDERVAMSCEGAPPECYIESFPIWDARVSTCPLHSFLFHEYGNGHCGFYTNRVSDETLRLSVARAIVTGYMLNLTLRDGGRIEYDWDQLWTRALPDQASILDWAKRTNQFRRGIAKHYLIYGRMLRPFRVSNVTLRDFGWGAEPLLQSATWQAQNGRIGIVLVNSGDLGESPRVELEGQGNKNLNLWIDGQQSQQSAHLPSVVDLEMQPRSLCLIEVV